MPVRLALVMDNEGVYMTNGNTTQWRYMGIEAVGRRTCCILWIIVDHSSNITEERGTRPLILPFPIGDPPHVMVEAVPRNQNGSDILCRMHRTLTPQKKEELCTIIDPTQRIKKIFKWTNTDRFQSVG